jgi:hypothetical protein
MGKNENFQSEVLDDSKNGGLLSVTEINGTVSLGKKLRRTFYLFCMIGIGFLLKSCMPGYVGSEPSYVEGVRPSQPSSLHVWVDGDWLYNRHNHAYTHGNGYWTRPREGRTFVSGHWQSDARGHSWTKGSWQRSNNRR